MMIVSSSFEDPGSIPAEAVTFLFFQFLNLSFLGSGFDLQRVDRIFFFFNEILIQNETLLWQGSHANFL